VGHSYRIGVAPPQEDGGTGQRLLTQQEWLAYLGEICELLWPPPIVVTIEGTRPGRANPPATVRPGADREKQPGNSELMLVPGVRRPPLLVPAAPRVAAAAVRHYSGSRSTATRLVAKLMSVGLARGLGGSVRRGRVRLDAAAGSDTIEAYLRDAVSRDIQVSMYLGPARANRKPVLQLLTGAGEPVGFAKVGVNPLTRELVRAEHSSLDLLGRAGMRKVTVPRVLHYGEWRGLNVLVVTALPVWQRHHSVTPAGLAAAMIEVAHIAGLHDEPLAGGAYLNRLSGRLAGAEEGLERAALTDALGMIADAEGDTVLTYGAWHGDWAPWNMANTGLGLLVWDWERFTVGVPLGFDALHHWLQAEVGPGHRDPLRAAVACVEQAAGLLGPFGIAAPQARLTALLYLADLATRYLVDQQAKAGARRGSPGTWLIPAITAAAARL
jgi:hypothetical protein